MAPGWKSCWPGWPSATESSAWSRRRRAPRPKAGAAHAVLSRGTAPAARPSCRRAQRVDHEGDDRPVQPGRGERVAHPVRQVEAAGRLEDDGRGGEDPVGHYHVPGDHRDGADVARPADEEQVEGGPMPVPNTSVD